MAKMAKVTLRFNVRIGGKEKTVETKVDSEDVAWAAKQYGKSADGHGSDRLAAIAAAIASGTELPPTVMPIAGTNEFILKGQRDTNKRFRIIS